MGNMMQSLQFTDPHVVKMIEREVPHPEDGEVLVRVEAVATCPHWDMHLLEDKPMFPGVPFVYPYPPGQPGHEATGIVESVGAGVAGLEPGMRVAAWRDPGQDRPGSYAQFNVFQAEHLLPVPESLPYQRVASLELAMCVQVAFDRLLMNNLVRGKTVAVSGMGPAGLVAVQMARAYDAATVVAIEPLASRRQAALSVGADAAYAPGDPAIEAIERRTDRAFDTAIDCTGLKASIEYLMDRTTYAVSIFGVLREHLDFAPHHWVDLALLGYGTHNREAAQRALDLISEDLLDLAVLITHSMPLSSYRAGIELLAEQKAIKVCFLPWET